MYSIGEVVWAKSSVPREIFWPAKVVEPDKNLNNDKSKKPCVADVNFLAEDTYEGIRIPSCVMPFNCDRKAAFLKKGRCQKSQTKRLQFESAVKEAENYIKLHEDEKKTAGKKSFLDTDMETNSPRTRRCSKLLEQEKYTPKNEGLSQATTSNKYESKSRAFSSRKNNKSSLETTVKDTSSNSVRKKGSETDKCKGKITKKSGRVRKAKDKMTSKKTVKLKLVEKTKWNLRKNKHQSDALDIDLQDTENELKDLGGSLDSISGTKLNSNKLGMKVTCETCSTNETLDNSGKTLRGKNESKKSKQSRKPRLKDNIKALWRKKRGVSNQTTSSEVQTFCKGFITNLDSIPEERESEMDETRLTPREKRRQKRARNEIETSESFGRDVTDNSQVKKKLRLSSSEESSRKTDNRVPEVEKPLSNGLAEIFSCQNEALPAVTVSDRLPKSGNENTRTIPSSNETTQSLKDIENCLGRLGDAVGCSNADESKVLEMGDNCGCGLESEMAVRKSGDSGNETKVENMTEKEDGTDMKENELEDNVSDDSSSDEDFLPEAFSPSLAPKKIFLPGDVVWAKHTRFPFWPAQIGRADKRQKTHYYVSFLPKSDCKCLRIPKKNIISFAEDYERYKSQEMDTNLRKEFDEALKHAEDILVRRALPKEDNLLGEIKDSASKLDDNDDESSLLSNVEEDKRVGEQDEPVEKPEDSESGFESSDLELVNPELAEKNRSRWRRKQVSRYSNVLNELHWCKQRLLDIYRGKIPSSRHKTFSNGTNTAYNRLQNLASFGPIQDDETREAIIKLLKTWYDEETKTTSITYDYVFSVWLPEAMIHYIQMTNNVSAKQAEKLYLELAKHVDKREVRETAALLKKKTIDQATMQKTVERAKHRLLYTELSP